MTKDAELALGVNMSEAVKDNLGFAPVYDSSFSGRNPNINGYACVTGFFNQDYKTVHSDYKEYWHEGIDFSGNKDTQIKSLIYGQVVDFGTHTGNHDSGKGMGDYMIVQSLKDLNTYYLLVHLAYTSWNTYGIKRGMTITPGMIVAGVGTQEWIAAYHLHVSVIVLEEGEYPIYINERQKTPMIRDKAFRFPVWSNENKNKMRNPFNHKETWKGRL